MPEPARAFRKRPSHRALTSVTLALLGFDASERAEVCFLGTLGFVIDGCNDGEKMLEARFYPNKSNQTASRKKQP